MSKLVKEMIVDEYRDRFDGVNEAVVVDIRLLNANQNVDLRSGLKAKDIRVTVVRNRLAKQAFSETELKALDPLLEGPTALVTGAESVVHVARELVDWVKKIKTLELKGAVLDGDVFSGKDGVEALSKFPTRDEAQGQVVQLVLSPASNLVSAVTAPGAEIVSIVQQIADKLEDGETIDKVSA
ncbi:MAG: 50S ribosomal protein L10 [Planctomycetes bacterium]|nr:50S ribosomal protein L10 [Planctomycetota bacterium]NOG55273.1 50S ribosomal protein L10 [Planctomycetota bacterium]